MNPQFTEIHLSLTVRSSLTFIYQEEADVIQIDIGTFIQIFMLESVNSNQKSKSRFSTAPWT